MHLFHVDNIAKDSIAAEVKDPEEVYQEEQQEYEVADSVEEQALEVNFANAESQQGKPQFIYPSVLHKFKLYASTVAS